MARQLVALVVEDATGDRLAAHLIRALAARMPQLEFTGIGGPHMEAAGATLLLPMDDIAGERRRSARVRRQFRDICLKEQPCLFVGVDAPDFNLELAAELKGAGIPTVEYVSAAILGWPREHILQARRAVSLVLSVLPIEARVYQEARVPVTCVGHPFADTVSTLPAVETVRAELRVPESAPVVAVMPGATPHELQAHAALFLPAAIQLAQRVPEVRFLAPVETRAIKTAMEAEMARFDTSGVEFSVLIGHSLEAMAAADVVLAPPGAASLEAALLKRPMVIAYPSAPRRWWQRARAQPARTLGLPNLLVGKTIVPELTGDEATPEKLADALFTAATDDASWASLDLDFEQIRTMLRHNNADKTVAALRPLMARGGR